MVLSLSVLLECFLSMIAVRGFLHSFGGSGGSGVLIGGLISGNGVWRKFWLGRLMIFGSSMNAR
jgi:hypothetical protein